MNEPRLIVISDLHVSTAPLEDFDTELQGHLCQFLADIGSGAAPVELVINGDFLDFVQARPWEGAVLRSLAPVNDIPLCFTQAQSLEKLENIHAEHAPIFCALGQFLTAKGTNRLIILPGNHDADFFWPEVRNRVWDWVCGQDTHARERLVFHLGQVYQPVAFPGVWIEHGHQHDVCNSFWLPNAAAGASCWSADFPPILTDRYGQKRLVECAGTRFLLKYLNDLDVAYPFVDNVKPLSRFLTIFGLHSFLPSQGPFKAAVAVWGILRFLAGRAVGRPSDLLTLPEVGNKKELGPLLTHVSGSLNLEQQTRLAETLLAAGLAIREPLLMVVQNPEGQARLMDLLAENPQLAEGLGGEKADALLSAGGPPGTLSLTCGFLADETTELKRAARKALAEPGTNVVIMGHTHEVVKPSPQLNYINTGCWTRYYRFQANESVRRWPLLRTPSYELFPYQLNYAEVVAGATPRLETFESRP